MPSGLRSRPDVAAGIHVLHLCPCCRPRRDLETMRRVLRSEAVTASIRPASIHPNRARELSRSVSQSVRHAASHQSVGDDHAVGHLYPQPPVHRRCVRPTPVEPTAGGFPRKMDASAPLNTVRFDHELRRNEAPSRFGDSAATRPRVPHHRDVRTRHHSGRAPRCTQCSRERG